MPYYKNCYCKDVREAMRPKRKTKRKSSKGKRNTLTKFKSLAALARQYNLKGYFEKEDGTRVTHNPYYYYGKSQYDSPPSRR